MENQLGLLRIRIIRGINLAIRDLRSSDPYVVISMGKQKLKTRAMKKNLNPQWNEDLTLCIVEPILPIKLQVYDKDTFSRDDKMGDAEVDIVPFIDAVRMTRFKNIPNGFIITRIMPSQQNCYSEESCIVYENGKKLQTRVVKKNVNPEWNEDLTLCIFEPILPVKLQVYDKDTFSRDDKMGDAEFDIVPFIDAVRTTRFKNIPNGFIITRIMPSQQNCYSEESCIVYENGKVVQNAFLRLRNVECGEIELQLQWIDIPTS